MKTRDDTQLKLVKAAGGIGTGWASALSKPRIFRFRNHKLFEFTMIQPEVSDLDNFQPEAS